MLEYGADVQSLETDTMCSPLHLAIMYPHIVELLLKYKADVHFLANGNTPLHFACLIGFPEALQALIVGGANVDFKGDGGKTALHIAASYSHQTVATTLLNHGADVNSLDEKGLTPLHMTEDEATARILLQEKAEPNLQVSDGPTVLHMACANALVSIAALVLDYGADMEATYSSDLFRPLHVCVMSNTVSILPLLLGRDANIESVTANDNTSLHLACRMKRPHLVEILLRAGANIEARNLIGHTPLQYAAELLSEECIHVLSENGANVSASDNHGRTALHNVKVKAILQTLLEKGADIHAKDNDGSSPLHHQVNKGSTELAQQLLDSGAAVDSRDNDGGTPLHFAINPGVGRLLLERGADIRATSNMGYTVFHYNYLRQAPDMIFFYLQMLSVF